MKDDLTTQLIKKSKVETTSDFTDKLIHKIEAQTELKKSRTRLFANALKYAIAAIIVICIVIPFFLDTLSFRITKTPLYVLCALLLLVSFNYILKLRDMEKSLQ